MFFHRNAILIVHGFGGGVYDLEYLSKMLELKTNYDVYTYTLPGHSGESTDKITYKDWIKRSEEMMEFLIENKYKNITVMGHSMGGMIATYLAGKYKKNVNKLVLIAPAFTVTGQKDEKLDVKKVIKEFPKVYDQYGFKFLMAKVKKLPINFYGEFLELNKKYQNTPKDVIAPTLLIWGDDDQVVPLAYSNKLINKFKNAETKIIVFKDGTHDIFGEFVKEKAAEYVIDFVKKTKNMYKFPEYVQIEKK